jgi:hypothetical protein
MSDRDTTSWGSPAAGGAGAPPASSSEITDRASGSTLAGTKGTTELEEKLDRLLALMGDEINVLPDIMLPQEVCVALNLTSNLSTPLMLVARVIDRAAGGRWLEIRLLGPNWEELTRREWRCVFRDPFTGAVFDRPGVFPNV